MSYIEGFIVPVRAADRNAYERHARTFGAIAPELGIRRMVEGWPDEVPHGKLTDFYRAVAANEDETAVFSWFEYPSRKERDAANEKFRTDPRMSEAMENAPFDAKRMIFGGFETIVEWGEGPGRYLSGFIAPVPRGKKDAYRAMTQKQAPIFGEHGALRLVQAWADDVPDGEVTDFRRAVRAEPDEAVVLAFIEWASKQASTEGWDKVMKDERMQHTGEVPFDGKRLFWGGFETIVDTAGGEKVAPIAAPITA